MATLIDGVFIALMLISSILAFARGFTRELLSSLAVILAALGSFFSFTFLQEPVTTALDPLVSGWVAGVLVIVCVFLLIYVAVTVVTASIGAFISRNDQINFIDRAVGLAFGVARGLVVTALAWVVIFSAQNALERTAGAEEHRDQAAAVAQAVEETMAYGLTHELANLLIEVCPEDAMCDIALLDAAN